MEEPQNSRPRLSITQKSTGKIIFNAETNQFVLVDDTTNMPVYYISPDADGQPKVTTPSLADLGTTDQPEEIDVMPFLYDCLRNGLKDIPDQFKEVKKEIKEWLKQKYGINPKPDGFIDWYVKHTLTTLIKADPILVEVAKYFASRRGHASTTGKISFDSMNLPRITAKDVQEYCRFKNQTLEAYDMALQRALPPAPFPAFVNNKTEPLRWLGPTNGNLNQLDELYQLLTGDYLESNIEIFRGVFGNGPFMGPVIWKATTSELIWLLLELQNYGFLEKRSRQKWKMVTTLFVGISKPFLTAELKVLKKNLGTNLRREAKEKISSIVEHLIN